MHFLCIFNTRVPNCGTRFYPVAGAGAGFIVVGSLAARAASNERGTSEEEARNERTRPSAVSRCPLSRQPLPSAVAPSAVARCPQPSAVAVALSRQPLPLRSQCGGRWQARRLTAALLRLGGRRQARRLVAAGASEGRRGGWVLRFGGLRFFAAKTTLLPVVVVVVVCPCALGRACALRYGGSRRRRRRRASALVLAAKKPKPPPLWHSSRHRLPSEAPAATSRHRLPPAAQPQKRRHQPPPPATCRRTDCAKATADG